MPIWAKVDVDMPTDGKILGQPIAVRHLWTCLICLAKKVDDHGAIHGYDVALLSRAFNIPRKSVATGLTHFQAARMVELDPDGTIRLLNFTKRQGEVTLEEQRAMWRDRQDRKRGLVTRDKTPLSPVTTSNVTQGRHASRAEVEEDQKEEKDLPASSPSAQPLPSLAELSDGWPSDLLERVHQAIASTRTSGAMAEGPWRGFLMRARQFTPEIRVRAANEYLDRACAAEKKGEAYLIGMMRGENARSQLVRRPTAHLQVSDKLQSETPGRKVL